MVGRELQEGAGAGRPGHSREGKLGYEEVEVGRTTNIVGNMMTQGALDLVAAELLGLDEAVRQEAAAYLPAPPTRGGKQAAVACEPAPPPAACDGANWGVGPAGSASEPGAGSGAEGRASVKGAAGGGGQAGCLGGVVGLAGRGSDRRLQGEQRRGVSCGGLGSSSDAGSALPLLGGTQGHASGLELACHNRGPACVNRGAAAVREKDPMLEAAGEGQRLLELRRQLRMRRAEGRQTVAEL